jgi:hypothetical protein
MTNFTSSVKQIFDIVVKLPRFNRNIGLTFVRPELLTRLLRDEGGFFDVFHELEIALGIEKGTHRDRYVYGL